LIEEDEFQELLGEYIAKEIDSGQFSVGIDGIVRKSDKNVLLQSRASQIQLAVGGAQNS
jgi:hypothetical protein